MGSEMVNEELQKRRLAMLERLAQQQGCWRAQALCDEESQVVTEHMNSGDGSMTLPPGNEALNEDGTLDELAMFEDEILKMHATEEIGLVQAYGTQAEAEAM